MNAVNYLALLATTLFWAAGHPLGRIILQKIHPFQLGSMNLAVGFLSLFAYLAVRRRIRELFRMSARDIVSSLLLGVFGFFLYQICTFSALARIPASINAVLIAVNVVFIALLSAFFLRERITAPRMLGILIALGGVVLVTFNRGFAFSAGVDLAGCLLSLLAAVTFAVYTVLGKKILARNDPLLVVVLALFSGAVALGALSSLTVGFRQLATAGFGTWGLILFLGLTMIGLAYPLWFYCLKTLPATHASIFIYLSPVFAVILSLIILRERFSWLFWIGGAMVLGGIAVANLAGRRKPASG